MRNQIDELNSKLYDYESELERSRSIKENNEDVSVKIENLEEELAELRKSKIDLENILSSKDEEIKQYTEKLNSLDNETAVLSEEFTQFNGENSPDLHNEVNELQNRIEELNSEVEEKNAIIDEQGSRLSQVKLEKTDKEIEFIKLKEQIEDYKNEMEKLNDVKNNYMLEANNSLQESQKLSNKLDKVQNELNNKSANEEALNAQIQKQVDMIAELQLKIDELTKKENLTNETENKNDEQDNSSEYKPEMSIEESVNDQKDYDNLESNEEINFSFKEFEENSGEETKSEEIIEERKQIDYADDINLEEEIQIKSELENQSEDDVENILNDLGIEPEEVDDSNLPKHSEFSHLLYGNVSVVSVNIPRATMDIAANFKDYLNKMIENGDTKIVIDLAECEFVDSTVLGVLVSTLKKAMSKDGDVRIVWGDNTESSMFYITRMDKVFKLFDNLEDAVQSYQG